MSGLKVGESNGEYVDEHDGEYIVFTTSQPLQNGDVNGARDVYEWHCASPCASPAAQGEVHLISDGHDPAGVENGEAKTEAGTTMSATGSDIFFFARTSLVGQDRDVLRDLYDARIGGGFPAPPAEPSCSGDECQGRASEPPSFILRRVRSQPRAATSSTRSRWGRRRKPNPSRNRRPSR